LNAVAIAELSAVMPAHSRLRLLFPVQSAQQGLSIALIFLALSFVLLGLVRMTGGHAPPTLLLPAFAGMLPSIYIALPGAFEVHTRAPARHLLGDVDELVRFMGYPVQSVEQAGQAWRYRPNHPAWMRWQENEITVRLLDEHRIAIRGPKAGLRMLHKHLTRRVGGNPAGK
jgi:hypothetical protein